VSDDLAEYRALINKVSGSVSAIEARRRASFACRRGCDQCCHVQLEVLPVEAASITRYLSSMDPEARAEIRRRSDGGGDEVERCAMLGDDGACAIYEARPIVCRTQGHALSYPDGVIPVDAIRARVAGEVTWCPLNYVESAPEPADVLSASLLEELLFVVNRRFASRGGPDPEKRVVLSDLARHG